MNNLLSICIPTYNRANKIDDLLNLLSPIMEIYDIGVYISDNSSNDNTKDTVNAYQKKYKNLFYHRNEQNVGPLKNFEYVINWAETDFRWLLGDDDLIVESEIEHILEILSMKNFDLVVVNGGTKTLNNYLRRVKHFDSQIYTDKNKLLGDIGYHMSWISSLIFNKNIIKEMSLNKYEWSPFPHLLAIFEALGQLQSFEVYFENKACVYLNNVNSSGSDYSMHCLEYFTKDWYEIVENLNGYAKNAKIRFLYAHRDNLNSYGMKSLLIQRMLSYYNYSEYVKLKRYLPYATKLNGILLLIISIIPVNFIKVAYRIFQFLK